MLYLASNALLYSLAFTIPLALSPLFLGMWTLFIGITIAITLSLTLSAWIGMITAIIYISGLNVLFAYFVATAPNHHISSNKMASTTMWAFILIFSLLMLSPMNYIMLIPFPPQIPITKMFSYGLTPILLLLVLLLFFILIIVVKIASRFYGPLRPFNL